MGLIDKKEKETETTADNAEETKEVAVKSDTSLSTQTNRVSAFITAPEFLDAVDGAVYGTFPSVTANGGSHMSGEDDLGKVLKFQPIVVNTVYKMTPGSNDEEAKEYFKVAQNEEDLEEAKEEAIADGYTKAAIKKYLDVVCLIVECDKEDMVGEVVILQLAPSSQYTWRPLEGKCKMAALRGKLVTRPVDGDADRFGEAVVFTSTALNTKWKGNSFTKFEFSV